MAEAASESGALGVLKSYHLIRVLVAHDQQLLLDESAGVDVHLEGRRLLRLALGTPNSCDLVLWVQALILLKASFAYCISAAVNNKGLAIPQVKSLFA